MASLRSYLFPAFGAAVAVAGADKITGDQGYIRMFRHLGWSRGAMRAVAAAEMAGGALVGPPGTRRLGAAVLAATSAAVLATELRHNNLRLATPRALLLLTALAALALPSKR